MERGNIKVSDKLDVKGWSVESLYILMWKNQMFVNRRYQRKLVWNLEENQLFIDSLLSKYPVPSIILSEYEVKIDDDIDDNYEIIDGLQRLNAIALFMRCKFPIKYNEEYMYYDLNYCPGAAELVAKGKLEQPTPVLPFEVCNAIRYALIPVVVTMQRKERIEKIELIFNRINSQGRKLSSHDIRQVNNIDLFADLVRRVATSIRGDYTYDDRIAILDMPKISLRSNGLDYGIDPESSFWIRHGFFLFNNFRQSKDEELLAGTMAMCLLGENFHVNARNLNIIYDSNSKLSQKINKIVEAAGRDVLEKEFFDIIIEIDNIFTSVHSNFSQYLFENAKTANKDICFSALFFALYRLHQEGFIITNPVCIAETLKEYCKSTFSMITENISYDVRDNAIHILYSMLKDVMTKQLPRQHTQDDDILAELLSLSTVEMQMLDFKIGLTYFENGFWNNDEIEQIGKTLVAMANTNHARYSTGYVIIGVADTEDAYNDWNDIYNQDPVIFGRHFVVGIQKEAERRHRNVDEFVRDFSSKLKQLDISQDLLDSVLANMRVVDFHDKDLLILPAQHFGNSKYHGEMYRREFNKTIKCSQN